MHICDNCKREITYSIAHIQEDNPPFDLAQTIEEWKCACGLQSFNDNPSMIDNYYLPALHRIEQWHRNGSLHRCNNPAFIDPNWEHYFYNGLLHRHDGPASVHRQSGKQAWAWLGLECGDIDEFLETSTLPDENKIMLKLQYV
jgi:hypothetical protein